MKNIFKTLLLAIMVLFQCSLLHADDSLYVFTSFRGSGDGLHLAVSKDGMKWTEISVENDELGKPEIKLEGKTRENFEKKSNKHIHLSISHTKEYAVAFVVVD